ncbi:MAG: hypothetical protein KA712_04995 [Myxococcales bacterium]|nr:hypothetical protein [Myxococcales bacterium]
MATATPRETLTHTSLAHHASEVFDPAARELRQMQELAQEELARSIAGFRLVFTGVPLEVRSAPLLRQAWAVHLALEAVRSVDAALALLERERQGEPRTKPRPGTLAA